MGGPFFIFCTLFRNYNKVLKINREMRIRHYLRVDFLLFLLFCFSSHLTAQKLSYRQYSVNEGLAASTVYGMVQDHDGYIWMATENGVSRFNGYEFDNFTLKDGLPGNEVLKIHLDSKGRVWFLSYNGQVGFYEEGKFFYPGNHPALMDCQANGYFFEFFEDSQGHIWLGSTGSEVFMIDLSGKVKKFTGHQGVKFKGRISVFYENEEEEVIAMVGRSLFVNLSDGESSWTIQGIKTRLHGDRLEDGTIVTSYDDEVYMVSDSFSGQVEHLSGLMHSQITSVEGLQDGGFRILTWRGAYWFKDRSLDTHTVEVFLKGVPISSFLVDREGNYWLGSLGQGVFVTHPRRSLIWDQFSGFPSRAINSIGLDNNDKIWVGFERAQFGYLDNKQFVSVDLNQHKLGSFTKGRSRCNAIHQVSNGDILVGFDNLVARAKPNEPFEVYAIPCKSIGEGEEGLVLLSNSQGAIFLDQDENWAEFKEKGKWSKRRAFNAIINAIAQSSDGNIYAATNQGLRKVKGKELVPVGLNAPFLDVQLNALLIGKQGEIIMGSHGEGLGILMEGELYQIGRKEGLAGDFCKSLAMDREGNIWAATNGGLSKVQDYLNPKSPKVVNFRVGDGLPSNDVRAIKINGDSIWVGTEAGLSLLRASEQKPGNKIPFLIDRITISEKDQEIKSHYELPHDQNHLTIHYQGLYFSAPDKIQYRVKMLGIDTLWRVTTAREADFPILPPGEYTFMVDVSTDGLHWLDEPLSISFLIRQPFWATNWFLIAVVLVIGLFVFGLVRRRIKTIQARADLMQKAEEYKQVALRTQMNPHFIFNSLNSIQQFIALKDEKSALIYLSKFSRLIRLILDHSRRGIIPIADELKALNFYLELESLRADGKFEFEVSMDPEIEGETTMIPGLLIQPIVENAIWHGLMPREQGGQLKVHFGRQEKMILVTIEDNGIGREASQKANANKKKNHNSVGLKNLQERLQVFSKESAVEGQGIEIEDLTDENGQAQGTRVVLSIYSPTNAYSI